MPKRSNSQIVDDTENVNSAQDVQGFQEGDDTWDTVLNMTNNSVDIDKGDDNGYTKQNTNFYLKDGEEALIILMEDTPTVFQGHSVKRKTKAGKSFFTVEASQKTVKNSCKWEKAAQQNPAIGAARNQIAFPIVDSRGSYDSATQQLDGKPAGKIFLTPLPVAKRIKKLRDEQDGSLKGKILKLSKDAKNYTVELHMVKQADGSYRPKEADPKMLAAIAVPNIKKVYAPLEDNEIDTYLGWIGGGTNGAPAVEAEGEGKGGLF